MGKKKVGKQRHDKYYTLAKEAGYRSRAAFKLIQLNKKFKFLDRSVCVVDLCAAPGGWLQAASQFMPVSKLLIGVDLVPIKPLPNVITIQGDITTDSCKQAVKAELQTWSVDCVLHDGAPNVGKNWLHDAFQQVQLTLQALKLAIDILRPGGWFVTKIFRSKDYTALLDVMKKLFKNVSVTKPQASRQESAEVFAVCQHFIPPKDGTFLKFASVFKDSSLATASSSTASVNLLHPSKKRRQKAEGYADDAVTLFNKVDVSDFVLSDDHLELLNGANELVMNDERLALHPLTTDEIKSMCKDVKVLNRKEIKELLKWRQSMRSYLESLEARPEEEPKPTEAESDDDVELEEIIKDEKRENKKKRRKEFRNKQLYRKKVDLEMVIENDEPIVAKEPDLFDLSGTISMMKRPKLRRSDENEDDDVSSASASDHEDINVEENREWYESIQSAIEAGKKRSLNSLTQTWFDKEAFRNLETEHEDEELDTLFSHHNEVEAKSKVEAKQSDDGKLKQQKGDENEAKIAKIKIGDQNESDGELASDEDFVANDADIAKSQPDKKLDPEGLALGEMWIHSSKTRRQLIEAGFNRFSNNDDNLPSWFVEDEAKHCRPILPVDKEVVEKYKQRQMGINVRPIKKVAEAKFRKKRRAAKRMEAARKKVENIMADEGLTDVEKRRELKQIYKGCKEKRRQVTYVVAKKGGIAGRKPKGPYKIVDRRMKKDMRKSKANQKKSRGKGQRPKKKSR